jgi:hypothetical protein
MVLVMVVDKCPNRNVEVTIAQNWTQVFVCHLHPNFTVVPLHERGGLFTNFENIFIPESFK